APSNAKLFSSGRGVAASTSIVNAGAEEVTGSLLDSAGQVAGADGPRFTDSRIGTWGKGFGGFGRANGASVENYGGLAGYGSAIHRHLVLGFALSGFGASTRTNPQQVNDQSVGGGLYAIDTQGNLRLSASLDGGYLHQNSLRDLYTPQNQRLETAAGSSDGWYLGVGVQGQYLIPVGANFLMPYGRIQYAHTHLSGFAEHGANYIANLNIAYGSLNTSVAAFTGGLRAGTDMGLGGMTLIPWVSVGGTGYAGTLHVLQSETVGLLSSTAGALVAPDAALDAGAGLTLRGSRGNPWAVKVAYHGQFGGDTHLNSFDLLANYRW
ncbi:MAG: autotransporter outer membrane beta-barrel domain-containing protein, partial [Acidithiobacillus sp.]|uniref:autotransporter outer membrane beta-barrel domain-containing protein n=1 Tax=Acidithiobacillus sp. TaxID=1872118 RepID=UPI003D038B95